MTNISLDEQIRLTNLATCSISMHSRYCPVCSSLMFRGEALYVEIKCRKCKYLLTFQGETVRSYNVQPY